MSAKQSSSNNHNAIFTTLLGTWDKAIRASSRAYARTPALAEDFAQEARLRLFRAVARGEPLDAPFIRTLIRNAMRNARRDEMRGYRELSPARVFIDDSNAELLELQHVSSSLEDRLTLTAWIAGLTSDDALIIRRAWIEGCSQREIAGEFRRTQPWVLAQIQRLRISALQHLDDPRGR